MPDIINEVGQLTTNLAEALEGLLGQAAVDGADADEINPQVVFAANEALKEYKRHPMFNPGDCSLSPEASKLSNGAAVQLLGVCVRDLIPLAEGELQTRVNVGLSSINDVQMVERARQAVNYLNGTELFIENTPSNQFDEDFEIKLSD